MHRRVASVLTLVAALALLERRSASAQDIGEALLPMAAGAETAPLKGRPAEETKPRPAPLVSLYGSFAALQALDIASTRMALKAGGVEANPLIAPFAGSPVALTTVKVGVVGAVIFASERLWKKNRKAAVLTMIGLNVAYGAVVAHNYGVAARRRR